MNTATLKREIADILVVGDATQALANYRYRKAELENSWRDWLFETYGPEGIPTTQLHPIFEYAWEHSHSSGYDEVEGTFDELCRIFKVVLS